MGVAHKDNIPRDFNAMTGHKRHSTQSGTFKTVFACSIATALTFSLGLLVHGPAAAQSDAVIVDLSVIADGGITTFGPQSTSGLLVPPRSNPVSKLHMAPQTAPKLRAPVSQLKTRPTVTTPVSKATPAPKAQPSAPAKKEPVVASKPAVPLAPAPKPMPAPQVTTAQPTPPPPAPVEQAEKKAAPSPASAPVVASAAPPPPPKVAAAPEPKASVEQANTNAQAVEIAPGQALRIAFEETETKLPDAAKDALRKVADGVHDKNDLRLQLLAYAGSEGLSASKARRLSLSRALSVRSFLIENGVRSTRIDVRALGNKTSDKPANRVDVNIAKR